MMSLFSPFDLCFWKIIYLSSFFFLASLFFKYWSVSSSDSTLFLPLNFMNEFFFTIKPLHTSKTLVVFLFSLMTLFFLMNFSSIFSYNFALTSQCSVVFSVSLTFWSSFLIFSLSKNLKMFLSHCIPEGSPSYLVVILFVIEIISNLIRPLTLMIRLVANILAGHLLMSLLSGMIFKFSLMFPTLLVLNLVEIFVSLIQAYIFSVMLILYFAELF